MNKRITTMLVIALSLLLFINSGCGGGGGGSTFSMGMPGTTTIPDIPTPGPGPTVAPQATAPLSSSGYVYVSDGKSPARAAAGQIIVLSSNTNPPSGFIPAVGYLVRSSQNIYIFTRTDANGFFNLGSAVISSGTTQASIIVGDPAAGGSAESYPVIAAPMPASSLTDIKIVPPFNYSTQAREWSLYAGQCELFFLVGKSGNEWHPVSDSVTWSISKSALGAFQGDMGVFQASDSITSIMSGTVNAACGGTSYTLTLKVVSRGDLGSLEGYVKESSGNPVANVIVDAQSSASAASGSGTTPAGPVIPCSTAITDDKGHYILSDLPFDSYRVRVYSFDGSSLAEETIVVNGKITKNFTVTGGSTTLYGSVLTDQFSYKPGDTIKTQVSVLNSGSTAASLNYGTMEFRLVNSDIFAGTSSTLAAATTPGGTASIPAFGQAAIPATAVSLVIPQSADNMGHYSIEVSFTSSPAVKADSAIVMIGDTTPIPMPTPTSSPLPQPTPTTTSTTQPPSNDDYYTLREIKSRLNDAYYEIYRYADRAYYGEDVKYYVNEGSSLQYNLKNVRNYYMPNLKTVSYWGWQNQIDSILSDLNRYAYYGGSYSDLYSAANSDNYLLNEVSSKLDSMRKKLLKPLFRKS